MTNSMALHSYNPNSTALLIPTTAIDGRDAYQLLAGYFVHVFLHHD